MSEGKEQTPERVSLFSAAAQKASDAATNDATENLELSSQDTTVLSPYDPVTTNENTESVTQVLGGLSQTFAPPAAEPTDSQTRASDEEKAQKAEEKALKRRENKEKGSGNKKKVWIAVAAAAGLLAIAYFSGVYAYSSRFFPHTSFGSVDVSNKTFTDAQVAIEESARDYSLAVTGQGLDFTVTPAESGMELDASTIVQSAHKKMNPWAWPAHLFKEHNLVDSADITLDNTTLGDYVTKQVTTLNETLPASEDARIEWKPDSSSFTIVPEVYGEQLDTEKVVGTVTSCIFQHEKECVISSEALLVPSVRADDKNIVAGAQAANDMLGVNAKFSSPMADGELGTLDSSLVGQWIVFDENFKPSVNQEPLTAWATEMVSPLSTVGATRSYTRPDGKQVTVSGGTFGCSVSTESIVAATNKAIEEKAQGNISLERQCAGNQAPEGSDSEWGAYVDVDLSEQHARYYDASGKLLWESGIVSGNPNAGHATPTGVYFVNTKQQGAVLRAPLRPDGTREYEVPVAYWMPFINNSHGLHDLSSRPLGQFNDASTYLSGGSHGCVNLPLSAAGSLYSIISVGTPVIVHN